MDQALPPKESGQDQQRLAGIKAFGAAFKTADPDYWDDFNAWDCALLDGLTEA